MSSTKSSSSRVVLAIPAFVLLMACVLGTAMVINAATATRATAAGPRTANLHLTILATKPGTEIGPAYSATDLTLPAHAKVTVTIVDQDLGDTALPAGSPFSAVRGTVGNVAYVDGIPYRSLDPTKVAHTFTVPQLGLNVPLPGDLPSGQKVSTVTFTFVTGKAGTYMWQCMDPCGSGSSGWEGPMATMGYMMGTLTVK